MTVPRRGSDFIQDYSLGIADPHPVVTRQTPLINLSWNCVIRARGLLVPYFARYYLCGW